MKDGTEGVRDLPGRRDEKHIAKCIATKPIAE